MKFPTFRAILCAFGILAAATYVAAQPAPAAAPAPTPTPAVVPLGPRMDFASKEYNFGRVNMGQQVNHVYVVSNSGDATLIISNVQPGCHCTTARPWTREIAPGKTGEIPIKFDSSGFHGDITRTITVTSNGKNAPVQTLFLRGSIWREIEVNPQTAYMSVPPESDTPTSTVVHIINQGSNGITLSNPTCANNKFKVALKETVPGKEFELTITAMTPLPAGNNIGTISVNTSSTNVPVLTITALAMVQQSIGIAPLQIVLPPEVLSPSTNIVTITANGKKPLTLSDLKVCCDKGIQSELKEIMPGRVYHLLTMIPAGFHIPAGEHYHISLKSNSAEKPEIDIPISQFPRSPGPAVAHPRVISQVPPPPAPISSRP